MTEFGGINTGIGGINSESGGINSKFGGIPDQVGGIQTKELPNSNGTKRHPTFSKNIRNFMLSHFVNKR
jgi:hypothetical protein